MDRETVKQALLDYGWDAAERQRIAEVLRFLKQDAQCQAAVADYDRIRAALRSGETETEAGVTGGTREAEPIGGWEAFAGRMQQAADRAELRSARRLRPWLRVTGMAAALLAALGLGWWLRPVGAGWPGSTSSKPAVTVPAAAAAASLAFAPQEIRQNVSAFRQVADVFDQRASWMLVADRTSDVGLGRDPTQPEDRLLLLRLTVCKGEQVVSRSDLVIVPGEGADLTVPLDSGQKLRYHIGTTAWSPQAAAMPPPPTRLSLWAELQSSPGTGRTLAALATDLPVQPGQVLGAGEMVTTSGSYALKIAFAQADRKGG
jgi:hypothetical protein